MKSVLSNFALIGSGRVASHLAPTLVAGGLECKGVYSSTFAHATSLAERLGSSALSLSELTSLEVDFVLVSVKDDAIAEVAHAFPDDYKGVVLHTSGGTSIDALAPIEHRGVLYPMQTFSPDRVLDITEIPIFPEGKDEVTLGVIDQITALLGSREVHPLTSEERVKLHLASVFACNFVNHLYSEADTIMQSIGLEFQHLAPLVRETLHKAIEHAPRSVQTGPAIRRDHKTIERHIGLLQEDAKQIYNIITQAIIHEHFPN